MYKYPITFNSNIPERQLYISLPPSSSSLHVTFLSHGVLRRVQKRRGKIHISFCCHWPVIPHDFHPTDEPSL